MNPFLENLLFALEKSPPNLGDADSVLGFLYEAYTELNNLDNAQIKAVEDVKAAAVLGNAGIKLRAKEALNEIKSFTVRFYPEFTPVVDHQLNKLIYGYSYAEIVSREYSKDYMNKGLALAKSYQRGERDV